MLNYIYIIVQNQDPEPPASWENIRDASKNAGDVCAQLEQSPTQAVIGSEDCLYLNIYIPYNVYRTTGNPVMVWIHGGSYLTGSGNDTHKRPDYLMAKDVILVSINYRLGALGKICASKKTYHISLENVRKILIAYLQKIQSKIRTSIVY